MLHTVRECEWKKLVKTFKPPETELSRILCRDDEESLLKAIAEGKLYGFLVCDVSTPEHLIKEYEAAGFLFPPVVSRMDITEDHLSPYMRERYIEEQRKPQSTVVQTYNGTGIFVLSSMVQFWMERGMEISNVQKFIQYQPGCALEPFVQKVLFYIIKQMHLISFVYQSGTVYVPLWYHSICSAAPFKLHRGTTFLHYGTIFITRGV